MGGKGITYATFSRDTILAEAEISVAADQKAFFDMKPKETIYGKGVTDDRAKWTHPPASTVERWKSK
jgi:hypothetical protein